MGFVIDPINIVDHRDLVGGEVFGPQPVSSGLEPLVGKAGQCFDAPAANGAPQIERMFDQPGLVIQVVDLRPAVRWREE